MQRRNFLRGAAALAAAGLAALPPARAALAAAATATNRTAVFFLPGYAPESAYFAGRPVAKHPRFTANLPDGYDGPVTLVTRVDGTTRSVKRALMPVFGHEINVAPDGRTAFFNCMNQAEMLAFDTETLAVVARAEPHRRKFMGGGHSVFAPDGGVLYVAERADWRRFRGSPERHFGRIVLREPATLKVLDSFDCHGIAPHEINLLADGQHMAVANYGRTTWPTRKEALPEVVEPSLTIVEIASGKLVHKVISPDTRFEVRHIAAPRRDRIFAIQGRLARFADTQTAMTAWPVVYEPDIWAAIEGYGYLPAPVLHYAQGAAGLEPRAVATPDPTLMRYGQSIIYEPAFDEVIGTFPSRHKVVVFDGATGAIKQVIDVGRQGLRQPRGVVLHPDGVHYAVSGYWQDIYVFKRGSHALDRDRCIYETFFGHSHMSVA